MSQRVCLIVISYESYEETLTNDNSLHWSFYKSCTHQEFQKLDFGYLRYGDGEGGITTLGKHSCSGDSGQLTRDGVETGRIISWSATSKVVRLQLERQKTDEIYLYETC